MLRFFYVSLLLGFQGALWAAAYQDQTSYLPIYFKNPGVEFSSQIDFDVEAVSPIPGVGKRQQQMENSCFLDRLLLSDLDHPHLQKFLKHSLSSDLWHHETYYRHIPLEADYLNLEHIRKQYPDCLINEDRIAVPVALPEQSFANKSRSLSIFYEKLPEGVTQIRDPRLSPRQKLEVLIHLAEAIEFLHSRKIYLHKRITHAVHIDEENQAKGILTSWVNGHFFVDPKYARASDLESILQYIPGEVLDGSKITEEDLVDSYTFGVFIFETFVEFDNPFKFGFAFERTHFQLRKDFSSEINRFLENAPYGVVRLVLAAMCQDSQIRPAIGTIKAELMQILAGMLSEG